MTEIPSPNLEIKVAQNLPISNTGKVALAVRPILKGGTGKVMDILVDVNRSALLVPGEYEVYPAPFFPKPPTVVTGPGPVIAPLAHISYDHALQYFNIKVNPETALTSGQFSILVNMSDLVLKQ